MVIEWDDAKRASNIAKHQVDFTLMETFDWDAALTREDLRGDYAEQRFVSIGPIGSRLYVVVWTWRGSATRIISLRKANRREQKLYD